MKLTHIKSIMIGMLLLGLAGCDKADLPHVFSGNEVPPEVMSEPRVVTTQAPTAAQNPGWQRLGDVPSAPRDFTSEKLIDQSMQEMRDERAQAEKLKQAADMPPALEPPPMAGP